MKPYQTHVESIDTVVVFQVVFTNFIKKFRLLQPYCHQVPKMLNPVRVLGLCLEVDAGCISDHAAYLFYNQSGQANPIRWYLMIVNSRTYQSES